MNPRTILQQQPVNTTIGITTPGIGIMNMDINGSKPSAKRKANDADNPLLQAAKKSKKDIKLNASNKRKLNGTEDVGGLRIVRAPTVPTQEPAVHTHPTSQPTKKFRASPSPAFPTHSRTNNTKKDRDLLTTTREDPDVEEDVRQMEDEADSLRRKSQGALLLGEGLNPAFNFGSAQKSKSRPEPRSRSKSKEPSTSRSKIHTQDSIQELSLGDTPQMARNKLMREGKLSSQVAIGNGMPGGSSSSDLAKGHRRRSSTGRGKRISGLIGTGVISQPHTSVSDSSFYKHIDCELPESARAQQLLIWCSSRILSSKPGTSLPPLNDDLKEVIHGAQHDVIKMLAEKKINTNPLSSHGSSGDSDILAGMNGILKENGQNVKNRAREVKFSKDIERAKAEESAWLEVANFYNSYRDNVLSEIDRRPSANKKGKQRATSQELEDWESIREFELPERFRGEGGVGLARRFVDAKGDTEKSPLSARLQSLEFKVDSLHSYLNSALQAKNAAQQDLDARFAQLNFAISSRSHSVPPNSSHPHSHAHKPPLLTRSRSQPAIDPQDLLRALSRVDAERPPAMVSDAARRAMREVRRVNEGEGGGLGERRLTNTGLGVGVGSSGQTPRKIGTPRRGTPRKER